LGSPTIQPRAPSRFITQVALPWMPILCSIEPHLMPLRSPGLPLASGMNFGTTNSEMPLVPPARPAGAPAQVDDVLGHVVLAGRDEDLGAGDRVRAIGLRFGLRRMPRSVPQCGSVRHIVPVHTPDTSFGR
jgi:hypothetical protein